MRATDARQAKAISRLARFANGDLELVQRAIRASARGGKPADPREVVEFIIRERARSRQSSATAVSTST